MRGAEGGGPAQFLYPFEGCHNFGFAGDQLILVAWNQGINLGSVDGTQTLRRVAVLSASSDAPTHPCDQVPVVVGDGIFHRHNRALIATHLQTGKTRLLLPDFGELLGAGPDYVYELKSDQTSSEKSGWTFDKRDLSSGESVRGIAATYDTKFITFSGGLHDGYAYLSALRRLRWSVVHRVPLHHGRLRARDADRIHSVHAGADRLSPGRPTVAGHCARRDRRRALLAASFGAGSVLYRVPLPPDTRSPATLVP